MKIEKETSGYNQRRYSRPWIARVDFTDPKGLFTWGEWVGDHRNGSSGLLIVDAEPGDIVATGQKDFRQPRNSSPDWWRVGDTGQLESVAGKVEAYNFWRQKHVAQVAS